MPNAPSCTPTPSPWTSSSSPFSRTQASPPSPSRARDSRPRSLRSRTEKASGLLVVKLDRLTRSVRDLGELVDRYFATRFSLLSLSDSIDTRTASGRLVLHVLGAVGQWEREAAAERTRDALAQLRADGVRLGGEAFGWRRSEARDTAGRRRCEEVVDEEETIRRVRELRRQGLHIKEIIATLEAEGRQTKRGGRWHPTTVHRLLQRDELAP